MAGRPSRGWVERRRAGAAAVAVLCVAAGVLIAPSAAVALSRSQADGVALSALTPTHSHGGLGVIVYGMPSALPANDSVDVFRALSHQTLNRHALGHRTWLFWEDLAPGAMFSHASVLLLVNDASGGVQRRTLEWWPLINGRPPPFLAGSSPPAKRYVVFSSVPALAKRAASPAPAAAAEAARGGPLAWPAQSPLQSSAHAAVTLQITPQNLAHDCMITVGLETATLAVQNGGRVENVRPLTSDFQAIRGWAKSVGLNTYDGGDTNETLDAAVTAAIEQHGCTDVFIFLAGHGTPPPGKHKQGLETVQSPGGPAGVLTRAQYVPPPGGGNEGGSADTQLITPADLVGIMAKHDASRPLAERATFKIKIDSCFAGRFVPDLKGASNLEFLEVSSAADETSFFHLGGANVRRGGRMVHVKNDTDNPHKVTEFMNRDLHGLETWATSPQAHDEPTLASGLAASFLIGEDFDFAATVGFTTPEELYMPQAVTTTFPPPPPPPTAAGWLVSFGSTMTAPADVTEKSKVEEDLWSAVTDYCKEHPSDPLCVKSYSSIRPGSVKASIATAVPGSSAVPGTGQILSIQVKGIALAKPAPAPAPLTQIHFQDLRPQPDGSVVVIETSQPFNLPSSGEPNQITTFVPTNMCVQAGDYLTLSTEGGAEAYYPEGTPFQVFASSPGSTLDYFIGYEGVNNGAKFTGTPLEGVELLMQATLGTGDQASSVCPGGTKAP